MTALRLLKDQHKSITALFHKTVAAVGGEKRSYFEQLADLLSLHLLVEERNVYPIVRALADDGPEAERATVQEHLIIKRVLVQVLELSPSDDAFDARLKVLGELTEQHFEEEETDVFPRVLRLCSQSALDEVAAALAASTLRFEREGVARRQMALDLESHALAND